MEKGRRKKQEGRHPWADLIARIFKVCPLDCSSCGARMHLVDFVTDPQSIHRILTLLNLPTEAPILERARDPPQMEFNFFRKVYREDIDLLIICDQADSPFPEMLDPPHPEETYDSHPEETYDIHPDEIYEDRHQDASC